MKNMQMVYVPVGVPTFELVSAQRLFEESCEMLKSIYPECVCPEKMLLSLDDLKCYLDLIHPDMIVLQNVTFANSAYAEEVFSRFQCPIVHWTLREPVIDGGRLRLNSLTGAYSASNAHRAYRDAGPLFHFIGMPEEEEIRREIKAIVKAVELKKKLSTVTIASIGNTPQGFGFGRATDARIRSAFGVKLESYEARELIRRAKQYSDEEMAADLPLVESIVSGLSEMPENNVYDFLRLARAYREFVRENHIDALSSRCWPDFFTEFGTPVCMALSLLNDDGIPASCEADTYGALSMLIGSCLSGGPVFFGDPVSLDEENSAVTFWHCGAGACSLAKDGTKAGVHCNRKIGPTCEFVCRPSESVSLIRVGAEPDGGFRILLKRGWIEPGVQPFIGTSAVVKMEDAEGFVNSTIEDGWEPHFVVAFSDIGRELYYLARILDIDFYEY